MRKFDLVYEDIMKDLQKSYVNYQLTSEWIKEVEENMKSMSREEAEKYMKSLQKYTWNDLGKKEALEELFNRLYEIQH
jgi:Asp-tRNA(Asn)/Glu-tRNA(Gln) amidotransferase B subunit